MSATIDFIIIDSIIGQYTIHYPVELKDNISFVLIKRECLTHSWDFIKNDNRCYIPCLSTNQDPEAPQIDESHPLSFYHLENGGVIFLHYVDLALQIE